MKKMDFPGVSFYVDNKKIFPLSSGIQKPSTPLPYEFQGVPITGHTLDTQHFLEVKDPKFSSSVQTEKRDFSFAGSEQFSSRREMCGHLNSFPAISFSQLVGGFVGSKSQIRSVNREACQIWDVIFRQVAETSCQSSNMQNHYYNFGKAFSQNLLNSICQDGKSALDGIASYLISTNCEFLQEQEILHSVSVSEMKSKNKKGELSMGNEVVGISTSAVDASHISVSLDNFSAANLVLNSKPASTNALKQSYAEVAKSIICKPDIQSTMRQSNQSSELSISKKFGKKSKVQHSKKSKLSIASKPETRNSSEHIHCEVPSMNFSKNLKRMDRKNQNNESQALATFTDRPSQATSVNQFSCYITAPQQPKKMTQHFRYKGVHYRSSSREMSNWRERRECFDPTIHQPSSSDRVHYKHFNMIYPAFSRKNHRTDVKPHRVVDKSNSVSKNYQNHEQVDSKALVDGYEGNFCHSVGFSEVTPFGRKFRRVPEGSHSKVKDGPKGRRDCKGRKHMTHFSLRFDDSIVCKNWRCRHKGVLCCETANFNDLALARKNSAKSDPICTHELCIEGTSSAVASNNEGFVGKNLENQSQDDEYQDHVLELSSSVDRISVSSSCGDMSEISEKRNRFLSECSVDSDDSFVVFFESECTEDISSDDRDSRQIFRCSSLDLDESDGWSDCDDEDDSSEESDTDNEDQDEVDFVFFPPLSVPAGNIECSNNPLSPLSDRLKEINQSWRKETACIPSEDKSPKKVHFANSHKLTTVHPMVRWDFAYRAARCGPWEEMARDRTRFRARIDRLESILAPVLTPEHRQKVRERMDSSVAS